MAPPTVDGQPGSPRQNRILAALSPRELARLDDGLERVHLEAGALLHEAGEALEFAHFPTTCSISTTFSTESGAPTELAMIGNDGLVGLDLVLGGETSAHRQVVQRAGAAYRLRAELMAWELDQGGTLQRVALRYAQAMMAQLAQGVVCNRHHSVEQRLCRWLLFSLDLQAGVQLEVTHEAMAGKLGVRREGVTEAAGRLQASGLIRYRRGRLTVVDRAGLELCACECYRTVKSEYERLFCLDPLERGRHAQRANPATLRMRAEAQLRRHPAPVALSSLGDVDRLLYELQVHQIELELHNEELRNAYDEADALRAQYADIYDFAPLGYFTLDAHGVIVKVNLAGAIMLGIKRTEHGRHRFAAFLRREFLPDFNAFLLEVLEAKSKRACELVLAASPHCPEMVIRIEAVADESGNECRMVASDITRTTRVEAMLAGLEAAAADRA